MQVLSISFDDAQLTCADFCVWVCIISKGSRMQIKGVTYIIHAHIIHAHNHTQMEVLMIIPHKSVNNFLQGGYWDQWAIASGCFDKCIDTDKLRVSSAHLYFFSNFLLVLLTQLLLLKFGLEIIIFLHTILWTPLQIRN